jgi:hypothetical protein
MAPGEFRKTHPQVFCRGGNADRGEHVLGAERRLEQSLEEIVGLHHPLTFFARNLDFAAERQQARRQFGSRIGKRDRAAQRAAVSDRGVADVRHGERNQRRMFGDVGRALGLGVAGQRADLDHAILHRDA